jgi:dTDP-4-amino-4,6-dideoxygalactose transaminase
MSNKQNIPFFNYPALFKSKEKEIMDTLHGVLARGAYILQSDLEEFEQNIQNLIGVKHVFGVADGTNALILALYAAGIEPGDEVIICSHTYIATAAAAHFTGATPVLVECGADHMIDPKSVEKAITDKTKVIMPTQLNGRTCDMDKLQAIADRHGLIIIEDAAQALSSKFKEKCAGTFGLAGTFSFYPAKLLGCFGDGGAVVTNDDAMAEKLFQLRDHGRNKDGLVVSWGTNSRLDNVHAAILNLKLKSFKEDIERRRTIARMYNEELGGLDGVTLPPAPDADQNHYDVYQNYELEASNRDELKLYLSDRGIGTIIQWAGKAVHQFEGLGFESVTLPVVEKMTENFLMLPMHTALSDDDVNYVCNAVKGFYK